MRRALVLAAVVAACLPASALAATDYSTAPFSVETHSARFGQAPTFMPDGRIVHSKNQHFPEDENYEGHEVYIENFDGSGDFCVTCGSQPGPGGMPRPPNGVPHPRPQGDWIVFHSWDERQFKLGGPGFGGLGSHLYVVRPDGTGATQLTGLDPDITGAPSAGFGEGEDAYHAYWSPDGKRLVWAHLNWNFITKFGRGHWDVRVADFVVGEDGTPRIENVQVVRPANGHYYETQWWAPDGSGFLYTESVDSSLNLELFFCKLVEDVEGTLTCEVDRLTNHSAWDEQALFTPDMKSVIFMSTRDHPGAFNTWAELAQAAGLPAEADYLTVLPLFTGGFLQPIAAEATDLYELNLETRAVRRLTFSGDDGWIIPEFTWDPNNEFLLWVEARYGDGVRMPLPLDPGKEVPEFIDWLSTYEPPPLEPPSGTQAAALEKLPLERRTRIGRFE
jgi:Tol biopolymer transport system component